MPISAWILTPCQPELTPQFLERLAADSRILCGEPQGARIPFVVDTSELSEESRLLESLRCAFAGLAVLELVCAHFDDVPTTDCGPQLLRRRATET